MRPHDLARHSCESQRRGPQENTFRTTQPRAIERSDAVLARLKPRRNGTTPRWRTHTVPRDRQLYKTPHNALASRNGTARMIAHVARSTLTRPHDPMQCSLERRRVTTARPQEDAIHARSLAIAQVHMVAYDTLASRNGTLRRITHFARSTLARSHHAVFARNVASARPTTHTMAFTHNAMPHRTITHGALAVHG